MPPVPAATLPPLGPAFTTADARAAGVSPARLRRADLARPWRGVRISTTPHPTALSWDAIGLPEPPHGLSGHLLWALQRQRPDAVLSHTTAAHLHGIPLPLSVRRGPMPARTLVEVTVAPDRRIRLADVRPYRRRLPPDHVTLQHGLRVTTPERTWLDLCALTPAWALDDLVAAGDHLVHHPWAPSGRLSPITTLDRLHRTCDQAGPVRGIRTARNALAEIRVGADSAMETHARLALVRAGLGEPLLQHRVAPGDPDCPEVDLFYTDGAVALEYDGGHHLTRSQQARDAQRDRWLIAHGIAPVRVTAEDHATGYRRVIALVRDRRRRG